MRLTVLRRMDELDSIRESWDAMQQKADGPGLFQSWTWSRAWYEHVLSTRADMSPSIQVLEEPTGRIAAIAPLCDQLIAGGLFKLTRPLAHRMSSHNDVLLVDPASGELVDQLVDCVRSGIGGRNIVHLNQLVMESRFTQCLIARGLAQRQCERVWVEADGAPDDPLARVSHSRRKQIRRAERKLREFGSVEFEVHRDGGFSAAFDRLIGLHAKRLEKKNKRTNLMGSNRTFLRSASEVLCRAGKAEVVELKCGVEIVASVLQCVDKRVCYSLNGGFDSRFESFSPMWVLDAYCIRRAFETLGCLRYDLGAAYGEYKYSWRPVVSTNYFAVVAGASVSSRVAAHLCRAAYARTATAKPVAGGSPVDMHRKLP